MKLPILLASLSLSLLTAAAAPRAAHACGPDTARLTVKHEPTREDRVREVVEAHFAAVARGDSKAARALWDPKAKIRSLDGTGKVVRTLGLRKALRRWIEKREGMSWKIGLITEQTGGAFDVQVAVTWDGVVYQDVLVLREDDAGKLVLVAKSSTPRLAERPRSPY